jgi:hypothetical protein
MEAEALRDVACEEIEWAEYRLPVGVLAWNLLDSRDGREIPGHEINGSLGRNRQPCYEMEVGSGSTGRASIRGCLELRDVVVVAANVWGELSRFLQ